MDPPYSAPEQLPLPHPVHHHHLFPCPHHNRYHHHHHVIMCTRHHGHLFPHRHHCPRVNTYCKVHSLPPPQNHSSSETNLCHHPFPSSNQTLLEQECLGQDEEEEEDDDEPVFVLTDEWRDFFAKSEAKRKLEKQQAKKKGRK